MTILMLSPNPEVTRLLVNAGARAVLPPPRVVHAAGAEKAMLHVREFQPELIILDLDPATDDDRPDVPGALLFCRRLKRTTECAILTCGTDDRAGYLALHLGADDFIRKPLDVDELEARIMALLRRSVVKSNGPDSVPHNCIEVGGLVIDPHRHRASLNGRDLNLTQTEFALLTAFARQPDVLLTQDILRSLLPDRRRVQREGALKQHLMKLRLKLEAGSGGSPEIVAFRGLGYKLVPSPNRAIEVSEGSRLPPHVASGSAERTEQAAVHSTSRLETIR